MTTNREATMTTTNDTTHYDLGHSDGYKMACDYIAMDNGRGEVERIDDANGATMWGYDLINAISSDEAAKLLGLPTLYDEDGVTDEAQEAIDRYNRGATDGWNQRVEELTTRYRVSAVRPLGDGRVEALDDDATLGDERGRTYDTLDAAVQRAEEMTSEVDEYGLDHSTRYYAEEV